MCGIAGIISHERLTKSRTFNMEKSIFNRGRDAQGCVIREASNKIISFFHSRLAILDLDSRSDQPMSFEHIDLIYNGEIYNFQNLKCELQKFGYSFSTKSDTEVLLKAYHYWGENVIHKLEGMFAFALLDLKNNIVLLARDRAGVKPLYYSLSKEIMFSSNMSTIMTSADKSFKINYTHLTEYLNRGYVQAPNTLVDGVFKLLPGTYMKIDLEDFSQKIIQYWDIRKKLSRSHLYEDLDFKVSELQKNIIDSLKKRLVSDCDIGVFLSGGYDSSTLLSILKKEISSDITAYTLGFSDSEISEDKLAAKIAKKLNSQHKILHADLGSAKDIFDKYADIWDEPIGDVSCIPTALLCKETAKEVKVALSADGADEVFAGYSKYYKIIRILNLRDRIFKKLFPTFIRKRIAKKIFNIDNNKLRLLLLILFLDDEDLHEIFLEFDHVFSIKEISNITGQNFEEVKKNINYSRFNDFYSELTHLQVLTRFDFCSNQQENILPKIDKASMFYGIEIREPMLDTDVVTFGLKCDDNLKLSSKGDSKYIIKLINHQYLPETLMRMPKKGFTPPIQHWFDLWFYQALYHFLNDSALQNILHNCNINLKHLEKILSGPNTFQNAKKKWSILVLLKWLSHNKEYICR